MTRRLRIGAVAAALLALASVVAVRAYSPGGFDAARWQAQRGSEARDNPRAGMLGDVMRLLKPSMTREAVRALLGAPESERDGRWSYDLGASPYGVDYEYLVIEFDDAGRLVRAQFMRG